MNIKCTINDIERELIKISSDDIVLGASHADEEILDAEKALNVTLPESFKSFLRKWGSITFGPTEYYGLTNERDFNLAGIPNFVWFTLRKRKQVELPDNLVIFQNINDEIYFCIDTKSVCNEDCDVVVWNNLDKEVEKNLKIGFLNFLMGDIEEYFEMLD